VRQGSERPGESANGFHTSVPASTSRKGGGRELASSLQCPEEEIPECRQGMGLAMGVSPGQTLPKFGQHAGHAAVREKPNAQLDF